MVRNIMLAYSIMAPKRVIHIHHVGHGHHHGLESTPSQLKCAGTGDVCHSDGDCCNGGAASSMIYCRQTTTGAKGVCVEHPLDGTVHAPPPSPGANGKCNGHEGSDCGTQTCNVGCIYPLQCREHTIGGGGSCGH